MHTLSSKVIEIDTIFLVILTSLILILIRQWISSNLQNSYTIGNTVFILIERKQKNNFKSGLRTIRVKTIPGSEFSCVN